LFEPCVILTKQIIGYSLEYEKLRLFNRICGKT